MARAPFKSATVVLGMHRSGTSALSGVLQLCGLAAPRTLLSPSEVNERGFWESELLTSLDDQMLRTAGSTWHGLGVIASGADLGRYQARAAKLLTEEYPSGANILLKDPRLCRLLPIWKRVLEKKARRVVYPIILRNPLEVADSLQRRNGLDVDHALLLWARYLLDAELSTRGDRRIVVSYPALLEDSRATIARLQSTLDLPLAIDDEVAEQIRGYLSDQLQHHHHSDDELLQLKLPAVREVYMILHGWSDGEAEGLSDHRKLDRLRGQVNAVAAATGGMFERTRLDRKRAEANRVQADRATAELARAHASLGHLRDVSTALTGLSKDQRETESRLGDLSHALKESAEERRNLADALAQSNRAADELGEQLAKAAERHSAERADLAKQLAKAAERHSAERTDLAKQLEGALRQAGEAADSHARERAELQKQLTQQRSEAAAAAKASAQDRSALLNKHNEAIIALKLQHEEALTRTTADFQEKLRNLSTAQEASAAELLLERQEREMLTAELSDVKSSHESLDQELARVKRKYRATQHEVELERNAHRATKAQLATIETSLARYESSVLWNFYGALVRLFSRIAARAGVLTGAARKRARREMQLIAASGIFDGDWYLQEYPDVAAARVDALNHFYATGWREGRDPGPDFATSAYLKANRDVARAGMNPVIHYIEHGQSEGRPLRVSSSRTRQSSPPPPIPSITHQFPEAAPVYRRDLLPEPAFPWIRSYRILQTDRDSFIWGGLTIGFARGADERARVGAAFARFAHLSGVGSAPAKAGAELAGDNATHMIDGWYANAAQLRTRWRVVERPVVIRAYQHAPDSGQLKLVAESLLISTLDVLDVSLVDPLFPVLFAICERDGSITETLLLAFPSLCRGGIHYSELLAHSPEQPDPVALGLAQAARVEGARDDPDRLIAYIAVDSSGTDGTSSIFDPTFLTWLEKVGCRHVVASERATGPAADILPRTPPSDAVGCGSLLISGNMVPTLHALGLLNGTPGSSETPVMVPLAVSSGEPSQPALIMRLPSASTTLAAATSSDFEMPWPRFVPTRPVANPELNQPWAIRTISSRTLADAELLVPASGSALAVPQKALQGITWLIAPSDWKSEQLLESLEALSLQELVGPQSVIFVGSVTDEATEFAATLFDGRVTSVQEAADVANHLKERYVGYLGPGVLLHDRRCAAFLAQLIADPTIVSATCPLLCVERRGKSCHVSVVDSGTIGPSGDGPVTSHCDVANVLWRSAFPISRPPRDFWIARSAAVKKWVASPPPLRISARSHLCTTLVTASLLAYEPTEQSAIVSVPKAAQADTISVAALYG
jgi:hypothetical protein